MRKIWQLYIIFFVFFVFGDLLSTFAILEVNESVKRGEREAARPPECVCKMPPHCDRSLAGEYFGDSLIVKATLLKLGIAALVLFLVFADLKLFLLSLTVFSVLVTGNNLGILFFQLRFIIPFFEWIGIYYLLKHFVRFHNETII